MAKTKKKKSAPPQKSAPPKKKEEDKKDLKKEIVQAHRDADEDIREDPDMELGGPDDDLDEGELAQLDNSND